MQHEISEARLNEQKAENRFTGEAVYPGVSGGQMTEYFGQVGLFAMRMNGKIYACDP